VVVGCGYSPARELSVFRFASDMMAGLGTSRLVPCCGLELDAAAAAVVDATAAAMVDAAVVVEEGAEAEIVRASANAEAVGSDVPAPGGLRELFCESDSSWRVGMPVAAAVATTGRLLLELAGPDAAAAADDDDAFGPLVEEDEYDFGGCRRVLLGMRGCMAARCGGGAWRLSATVAFILNDSIKAESVMFPSRGGSCARGCWRRLCCCCCGGGGPWASGKVGGCSCERCGQQSAAERCELQQRHAPGGLACCAAGAGEEAGAGAAAAAGG
jgi:hypothetical protein